MTVEHLVEKSKDQRRRARRDEALASAIEATEVDPTSAGAWWQVALNVLDLNGPKAALSALRRTTRLAPNFAYGWTLFGRTLKDLGESTRARECFERALREDPDEHHALSELADIYRAANDIDRETDVLAALDRLNRADGPQLNRLGVLHHQKKDLYRAIDYYRRLAALNTEPSGLFNLGLVYSELSQDADAIDTWRLCAKRYPSFNRAGTAVGKALPRMLALAARWHDRHVDLLDHDEWYANYVNPFELLKWPVVAETDLGDTKILQKLRKALLLEIDLEGGHVAWMPGLQIDRSRAIGICDGLNASDNLATYHKKVFTDVPLLAFLSRGDLRHFCVDERQSPLAMIQLFEAPPPGFQEWLDEVFSRQFDLVFSKALEKRELLAVEVLLDGRRWVSARAAERCFEGALRQVDRMLEPLRLYAAATADTKPSLKRIQDLLDRGSFGPILSLLPLEFHALQDEAVRLLRNMALASYNVHGDAEVAQEIIRVCLGLPFKSAVVRDRLRDDMKKVTELIEEERKDEVKLAFGTEAFEITKAGARRGSTFIPTEGVATLRWGTVVTRDGRDVTYDFSMTIAGGGGVIAIAWRSAADAEAQKATFGRILRAAMRYILPATAASVQRRIMAGERVPVGPVTVTAAGVEFSTGWWVFRKQVTISWAHITATLGDGDVIIGDSRFADLQIRLPVHSTDNAVVLHFLATCLNGD